MLESLFKLIDPKKLGFSDNCSSDSQRGLGILCGTYVFLLILGLIYVSGMTVYLFIKCKQYMDTWSMIKVLIYSLVSLIWQIFVIIFMINACNMCNGAKAFLLVFTIGIVISIISIFLLGNVQETMLKCMSGRLN